MTLGPNERDTSFITYCGRSPASSAHFRGGVVDPLYIYLKKERTAKNIVVLSFFLKQQLILPDI